MSWRECVFVGVLAAAVAALVASRFLTSSAAMSVDGAVVEDAADAQQQAPIAGVSITVYEGSAKVAATSDATGFFSFSLPPTLTRGARVTLRFRDPGYRPLDLDVLAGEQLVVARMTRLAPRSIPGRNNPR